MVTAVDIPPAGWDLQNEAKTLVLRLTDGVRTVDMIGVTHTAFIAQRRLFVGLLPSASVMGNDNVIVDETEHAPIPVYCFLGYDDQDPSSNTNVFVAGQRGDGYYVWISKLYRVQQPADFVLEEGASGCWSWRKWNGGKLEMWAAELEGSVGSWNNYTTDFKYGNCSISLPVSFVNVNYTCLPAVSRAATGGSAAISYTVRHTGVNSITVTLLTSASYTNTSYKFDLYLCGAWK